MKRTGLHVCLDPKGTWFSTHHTSLLSPCAAAWRCIPSLDELPALIVDAPLALLLLPQCPSLAEAASWAESIRETCPDLPFLVQCCFALPLPDGLAPYCFLGEPDSSAVVNHHMQLAILHHRINKKEQHGAHSLEELRRALNHDFRVPLRQVENFSHLLTQQYEASQENAIDYVKFIQQGAKQANAQTQSLLTYIGENNHTPLISMIDVNKEISSLVSAYHEAHENFITFTPSVDAAALRSDAYYIRKMATHIIDNTLRFKHADRDTHLNITVQHTTTGCTLIFQDNGIGLLPTQAEDVKHLLRKVNVNTPDQGAGLGLALVHVMARRLFGSVTLDPDSKEGCVVSLFLPQLYTGNL